MPKQKYSLRVGGDVTGSVFVSGSGNEVKASIKVKTEKTTLPPAETVAIGEELEKLRSVLEIVGGENRRKVQRALDDAVDEASRREPDRDEVGQALERALTYAQTAGSFAEELSKLAPIVKNTVGWLGSNWYKLLGVVGLSV